MDDAVRELIEKWLEETGKTRSWLSTELGRNHAYMQQYLRYGKPQELAYREKIKIHKLTGIPLSMLGIELPNNAAPSPAAAALGLVADIVPFSPSEDKAYAFLRATPGVAFYRAETTALERHRRWRIGQNDIIIVDNSEAALATLVEGEAYLVRLFDKESALTATDVIRQYVPDNLMTTNSSTSNTSFSLEDATLPYEPVVEGKIVGAFRRNHEQDA